MMPLHQFFSLFQQLLAADSIHCLSLTKLMTINPADLLLLSLQPLLLHLDISKHCVLFVLEPLLLLSHSNCDTISHPDHTPSLFYPTTFIFLALINFLSHANHLHLYSFLLPPPLFPLFLSYFSSTPTARHHAAACAASGCSASPASGRGSTSRRWRLAKRFVLPLTWQAAARSNGSRAVLSRAWSGRKARLKLAPTLVSVGAF